jgi:hypothetical protein
MIKYSNKIVSITLIFFSTQCFCQYLTSDYFEINSIIIDSSMYKNKSCLKDFITYDAYFFGERHNSENLVYVQNKFMEILSEKKNIDFLFLEYPSSLYYDYKEYFVDNVLSDDVKRQEFLSDYTTKNKIHLENIIALKNKKQKFQIIPIDYDNNLRVLALDILNYFDVDKAYKNDTLSDGLNQLVKPSLRINGFKKKSRGFLAFKKQFDNYPEVYHRHLGNNNLNVVKKHLESGVVYINAKKENSKKHYQTNIREEYMLSNILKEINDSSKFISFNGHFHIPLSIQDEWVNKKNWESLACRFVKSKSNFKTCSVYFMNRDTDYLSDIYFPKEKKIILENTKPGETFLIRLDNENTPFKELSKKFQYIVLW